MTFPPKDTFPFQKGTLEVSILSEAGSAEEVSKRLLNHKLTAIDTRKFRKKALTPYPGVKSYIAIKLLGVYEGRYRYLFPSNLSSCRVPVSKRGFPDALETAPIDALCDLKVELAHTINSIRLRCNDYALWSFNNPERLDTISVDLFDDDCFLVDGRFRVLTGVLWEVDYHPPTQGEGYLINKDNLILSFHPLKFNPIPPEAPILSYGIEGTDLFGFPLELWKNIFTLDICLGYSFYTHIEKGLGKGKKPSHTPYLVYKDFEITRSSKIPIIPQNSSFEDMDILSANRIIEIWYLIYCYLQDLPLDFETLNKIDRELGLTV
jgi:hypothetical protein